MALKLFFPVFWTTVVTLTTLVVWFAPEKHFAGIPILSLRLAMLFVLLTGLAFIWWILWPLKRVETDGERVYISNYFRTAYYDWALDIESFETRKFLFFTIAIITLKGKGSFGHKVRFLASRKLLLKFEDAYPHALPWVEQDRNQ